MRQFCLSGIESIQNIVSAEKKKLRGREQSASQKKVRKAKQKKTFDDARVEKTYSDDDYSSST